LFEKSHYVVKISASFIEKVNEMNSFGLWFDLSLKNHQSSKSSKTTNPIKETT